MAAASTPDTTGPLDGSVVRENGRYIVRFVRTLPVTQASLWSMLTEPDLVAGWLGPVESYELVHGGKVDVLLHPVQRAWLRGTVRNLAIGARVEIDWNVPAHGDSPAFSGSWLELEAGAASQGAVLTFSHSLPDTARVLDMLAASHLRLNLLPTHRGQLAVVDRQQFLRQRALYAAKFREYT